jgi:formylglycine-generating enzyme required for sulfatase activity
MLTVSKRLVSVFALTFALANMAKSEVSFEWVAVGDPGNPNDPLSDINTQGQTPPPRGAVPYVYSISKYETTIGQWAAFLNAVANSNPERAQSIGGPSQSRSVSGIARVSTDGKDRLPAVGNG